MKNLRILIIDDEIEACKLLSACIEVIAPNLDLLGFAHSVQSGIDQITQLQPDLVFLDVSLAPGSGFDILKHFPEISFQVIFTTAHEQFAIKAIRFAALDYLLKPIDPDLLEDAISRAIRVINGPQQHPQMEILKEIVSNSALSYARIVLPTLDGFIIEQTDQITYLEADRNYTLIHFQDGHRQTVSKTLKTYESTLMGQGFIRVHISYIVNQKAIKAFKRRKKGGIILLQDGTEIPLSENKKAEFLQLFA